NTGCGATVAEVKCNQMRLVTGELVQRPIAISHVTVRGAVKAITADAVPAIEMVWDGVEVRPLGDGRMECGIEDRHLRRGPAHDFPYGANTLYVIGVVQGSQIDAVLDAFQDLIVDDGGLVKQLATMHDTMSRGMNVAEIANLGDAGVV